MTPSPAPSRLAGRAAQRSRLARDSEDVRPKRRQLRPAGAQRRLQRFKPGLQPELPLKILL